MKFVVPTSFAALVAAVLASSDAEATLSTVDNVARAKKSVVAITIYDHGHAQSSGTGFFSAEDRIITDAHVVNHGDEILVQDLEGQTIPVAPEPIYLNSDKFVDIAILKVTVSTGYRPYLNFRLSPVLEGINVLVVSNPQGLNGTVSTGIVSAVRQGGNLVQFTAPVSNGSSGGPVLDEDGNVIGIADWILRPDGNEIAQNLNFAHGVSLMQTAMNSAKSHPAYVWQPNMPEDHKELNRPVLPAEPASPTPTPQPTPISTPDPKRRTWPDGRILKPDRFIPTWVVNVAPNDTLKLRSGPGTRFGATTEIPADASDIFAFDEDAVWDGDTWWYPIEWHGLHGYVGGSHLPHDK
jgi:hypothetical protein